MNSGGLERPVRPLVHLGCVPPSCSSVFVPLSCLTPFRSGRASSHACKVLYAASRAATCLRRTVSVDRGSDRILFRNSVPVSHLAHMRSTITLVLLRRSKPARFTPDAAKHGDLPPGGVRTACSFLSFLSRKELHRPQHVGALLEWGCGYPHSVLGKKRDQDN